MILIRCLNEKGQKIKDKASLVPNYQTIKDGNVDTINQQLGRLSRQGNKFAKNI